MYQWLKNIKLFSDIFKISDSHKKGDIAEAKICFDTLVSLDLDKKILLKTKMEEFIQKEADIRFGINNLKADIVFSCVFIPYFLSAVFAPILIAILHDVVPSIGGWIGIYLLHVLLSALLVFIVLAVGGSKGHIGQTLLVPFIVTILLFTLSLFLPQFVNIHSNGGLSFFYHLFASLITGILSIFIFGGIIFSVGTWLLVSHQNRKHSLSPIPVIVERLFDTLVGLEKTSVRWTETEFKKDFLERLEKVARLIEESVPRQLRSSDDYINSWSKQSFVKIANTFRSLNKKIIAPQQNTYDELKTSLAKYLELIILGRWGEIDQTEPEQISLVKKGWPRIRGILGGVIVGIIPFLIILLIQGTGIEIDNKVFDYLKIGAIFWAVLSITLTLDPQFKDKLASFKDMISIFGNISK